MEIILNTSNYIIAICKGLGKRTENMAVAYYSSSDKSTVETEKTLTIGLYSVCL